MAEDSLLREHEDALASERKDRAVAVLGLPELIAGVQVEPLTPRRLEWLRAMGNPFICGGACPVEAIPDFLWYVTKDFEFGNEEKRLAFLASIVTVNEDFREGIDAYIDRAYLDSPGGGKDAALYAPSIGLYHALNKAHPSAGWTLNSVMDTPLRVIFQILKCADKEAGCVVVNKRSDAVKGRMLDKVESWEVDTEPEVDPFIESKRAEGWGLFSEPFVRLGKWLITMRRMTDGK